MVLAGTTGFSRDTGKFHVIRGVSKTAVADGARGILNQVDHVFGAMHVACAEAEVTFTEHRSAEVGVGAGIVLPADDHDLLIFASRHFHAQVGPGRVASVVTINLGKLFNADLTEWVVCVQENRECVETNNVFDGILAILFSQLEFLVLDGPAGIG